MTREEFLASREQAISDEIDHSFIRWRRNPPCVRSTYVCSVAGCTAGQKHGGMCKKLRDQLAADIVNLGLP